MPKWTSETAPRGGNPGGRPKAVKEVAELAREKCSRAIERLAEIMECDDPKALGAAVKACEVLLERGYGRAPQTIDVHVSQDVSRMTTAQIEARIAELEAMQHVQH